VDRCAIFVDAGYLITEGAKSHVRAGARRGDVAIDYPALVERLAERARTACGLPLLRVYWYDGAVGGVPTTDQLAISALPDVKLRLGRISGGRQKGVDGLVYRDLSVLARERAVVTAFLLAGDEDLREGVVAAQETGVHVTLWGIGPPGNQARTLLAEVDRTERLDDVGPLFAPAPGSQLALSQQEAVSPEAGSPNESAVQATTRTFAQSWQQRATPEEVGELLAVHPHIPTALDAELLRAVQAQHGNLRDRQNLREAARAAFWATIRRNPHPP
jgi:NYN domain